jgi:SAD/SRA domain/HNH endonuclease
MLTAGEVISYLEMCQEEGVNLQRGMNYHLRSGHSVILMSLRKGAPYADRIEDEGRVLIYEGHDVPRSDNQPDPKTVDQPMRTPNGALTQNGLFFEAAKRHASESASAEQVRVYEKLRTGIWVFTGIFRLVDAWPEQTEQRQVFKFRLELDPDATPTERDPRERDIDQTRLIPTAVKLAVWKRDGGKCVECGSSDNLHFDHIIPYSRGGSSLTAENIQLLCARHNLAKRDHIQ